MSAGRPRVAFEVRGVNTLTASDVGGNRHCSPSGLVWNVTTRFADVITGSAGHGQRSDNGDERQYFYLARIERWSFEERTGPEFTEPGRGEYSLEEITLTAAGLSAIDLKPDPVAALLRDAVNAGRDLFLTPDLRRSTAAS